ncbi:hypothetical protein HID58_029976, partial [Brassica napus]
DTQRRMRSQIYKRKLTINQSKNSVLVHFAEYSVHIEKIIYICVCVKIQTIQFHKQNRGEEEKTQYKLQQNNLMASSKTCFFLVFLCLVVLLIPKSAQAEDGGSHLEIVQGPCSKFPDCNQQCTDLRYPGGGKCIKVGRYVTYLMCACFA